MTDTKPIANGTTTPVYSGYIARGVKLQQHSYGNRAPANDEEHYELTTEECIAMEPQLRGQNIIHWHGRGDKSAKKLGLIQDARFDRTTGDFEIDFTLNPEGEQFVQTVKASKFPLGLSLSHARVPLQVREVSLTVSPARDNCYFDTTTNAKTYKTTVEASRHASPSTPAGANMANPQSGGMDTSQDHGQQQQGQGQAAKDTETLQAAINTGLGAMSPEQQKVFKTQFAKLLDGKKNAERTAAEAQRAAEAAKKAAEDAQKAADAKIQEQQRLNQAQLAASRGTSVGILRELLHATGHGGTTQDSEELEQVAKSGMIPIDSPAGQALIEAARTLKMGQRQQQHQHMTRDLQQLQQQPLTQPAAGKEDEAWAANISELLTANDEKWRALSALPTSGGIVQASRGNVQNYDDRWVSAWCVLLDKHGPGLDDPISYMSQEQQQHMNEVMASRGELPREEFQQPGSKRKRLT